jgi:hypothetical protein
MIVRIMADGQYRIDARRDAEIREITRLDEELAAAEGGNDEAHFRAILARLIAHVRQYGQVVPFDELVPSDLMVPASDMTLAETRALLQRDRALEGNRFPPGEQVPRDLCSVASEEA